MLGHVLKNKLKVLLRSKSLIFWTLIFPIIMSTFFKLALSNIATAEEFDPVKIAVIQNVALDNEQNLKTVIGELSTENENQVFETTYIDNEEKAKEMLKNDDISGYIIMDENGKADVRVKDNGIQQTIIKYVIDEYYQTASAATQIINFNPQVIYDGTIQLLEESKEYVKDKTGNNLDYCVNYYYTAIAMACIYGGLFGLEAVKETEANLSKRAARVSVAPVHKLKMLFANVTAGFIIQYIEILILLAYIVFVLKGNLTNNVPWILLLSLAGSFAGTTFGLFIGISNKKDENTKVGMLIAITMVCSFFAGMMGAPQMKYQMEKLIPVVKYNPVSLITDGFHALYSYITLDMYFEKLISVIIFSIIMIALSYIFIRRKKYDSI